MEKGKKSVLNAIAALMQTAIVGIIGLMLNKSVLNNFGSDINGINATIIQLVNTIMLLEGGFTLASNVALFEPFANDDRNRISGIIVATGMKFKKIGILMMLCSLILAMGYPLIVDGVLSYWEIFFLVISVALPTCFNLGLVTKYRVLLLADQKEYVISFIYIICYIVGNIVAIVLINNGYSLLIGRVAIMIALCVNYILVGLFCKRKYEWVDYRSAPMYEEIKGTKSVISLKLMSFVYTSAPVLMISTIPETGLQLASVYSVYRSVIVMIKNAVTAISNAPRLSFGALFAEGNVKKVKSYFQMYEMIVCMITTIVLGVTGLLILPFVQLYTRGVDDISYRNIPLAILLIVTTLLELIHIPSGQMIQMKGDFKTANKIQTSALIVLVLTMIIGRINGGFIGIVSSVMLAAFLLAVLEIGYTDKMIFRRKNVELVKCFVPGLVVITICILIGINGSIVLNSYFEFLILGLLYVCVVSLCTVLLYYAIDYKMVKNMVGFLSKLIMSFIKERTNNNH